MSIFNWINKIFNIDIKNPNPDLPSEFQLPTGDAENVNTDMHNLEVNNFTDDIIRDFEETFQHFQNQFNESNISAIPMNEPTNVEAFNGIPKQNFIAQSTFLNPSSRPSKPLDQPSINITIKRSGSQHFESGSSISRSSYVSKNWNGRIIEKETSTNQLQNGIIETVTVFKDGSKQCVETITENSKTGKKMEKSQLSNMNQNELDELKKQFSKIILMP
ncbi:uncharacterized protein LOC114126171 isoform X2 [Aphis gossypii]|uniref:uncharacterized protein LOC114126171 isoform X2 n=1 Tax=Aphis gossypii TaxID=80765 RepID=UPI002159463A|nr:uncharacterized protein LOC114126171 isoform X2 [Aphis gossypii]